MLTALLLTAAVHTSVIRLSAELLVEEINRVRANYGLAPVHMNRQLALAADDRATDMLRKAYFDHRSPDGIDPFSWIDKRGYRYSAAGENLSVGYRDASALVASWMHSPSHRENILKEEFEDVGVAITAESPVHRKAGPLVVVEFGRR